MATLNPVFVDPVSQAELARYKQLETVVKRYDHDLAQMRQDILGRLLGPLAVEPGPYQVQVLHRDASVSVEPDATPDLLVYEIDDV